MEDNSKRCTRLPTLYDSNFRINHYLHYYYKVINQDSKGFSSFIDYDYNFKRSYFLPCQETINLGTKDNPLYSCTKCLSLFEDEELENKFYNTFVEEYDDKNYAQNFFPDFFYIYNRKYYSNYYKHFPMKMIDTTENNISYCTQMQADLDNCLEAVYKISNGIEIYNCTKCRNDFDILYNEYLDYYYCGLPEILETYNETLEECLVENCEFCIVDNESFCFECISSDYEINKFTGSCVLKTEVIPLITWKDIYKLNMNGHKEINGRTIKGPSIVLRGITSSEINTKHAFLIYLTFRIRQRLRNLQETIKIPAFCEINNGVAKTDDNINIVDYECIGTSIIDENYELIGIEDSIDNENIKNAGFKKINDIISETLKSGGDLSQKTISSFLTTENIIIFVVDENNKNKSSDNYIFNFTLNGRINKDITLTQKIPYEVEVEMYNITDKPKSTFYLENDRDARLNIFLELKNDVKKPVIYFGNSEINVNEDYLVYVPVLNEIELKNEKYSEEQTDDDNNGSKKKLLIIIICVIGVIVLGGIIILIICLLKRKKTSTNVFVNNNEGNNNINKNINYEKDNNINTEKNINV